MSSIFRPFRSDSSGGSMRRPSYHRSHQSPTAAVLFNKSNFGAERTSASLVGSSAGGQAQMMTQVEKEKDPLGVSFSPRRSMPEIKSTNNVISQLKRNSYQEESRISVSLLV